jgi:hypothetical protein
MLAEKGAQMLTPASKLGRESDQMLGKRRTRPHGFQVFKFPSTQTRHREASESAERADRWYERRIDSQPTAERFLR